MTFIFDAYAQSVQYKVITNLESIVPMAIGRSRIVEEKSPIDTQAFTTELVNGKLKVNRKM